MKPAVHYEVRNGENATVCGRATLADCRRLLAKYVTKPCTYVHWDEGPYSVVKVTVEHRFTHRPKAAQAPRKDSEGT